MSAQGRAFVGVLCVVVGAAGFAQSNGPRTSDGHPDFQGTYRFITLTPLQRPKEFEGKAFLTDAEAAAYIKRRSQDTNADRRSADPLVDLAGSHNEFWYERSTDMMKVRGRYLTSRITDPPDGRIPALTPAARERLARVPQGPRRRSIDGYESLDLPSRCLSPTPVISPGGAYDNVLQIVQTPDFIAIHTELMNVLRVISMKHTTHQPAAIRSRTGDSIGRWEGDTLIVDSTNFGAEFDFDFAAADENLHLTERFSRAGDRDVLYEVTIDDPTAYVRPWTMVLVLRRTDARMFEFACHEGNYSLPNTLLGARAEEERAKKPK